MLIHEVMDPETFLSETRPLTPEQRKIVIEHHTTPEQAGRVFAAVKPQLAVFSHIVPGDARNLISGTRATYSGPLEVGEDLMTIDVGNKVEVRRPH